MTVTATAPSVAAEPPPGWTATEISRPALAGGSGATLTQWTARRSSAGEVLLLGCVATPVPGWVEDMRGPVEARTASLAASSADRIAGAKVDASRTFLGWNGGDVVTCFATCASPVGPTGPEPTASACVPSVAAARLTGGTAPPPAGCGLAAVSWAVHHPSNTMLAGGLVTLFVAALAVVWRRRPRSRI